MPSKNPESATAEIENSFYHWILSSDSDFRSNNNAFLWDAYRPLVDHMPACTGQREAVCPGGGCPPRGDICPMGVCQGGCLPRGCLLGGCLPGGRGGGLSARGVSARKRGVCPEGMSAREVLCVADTPPPHTHTSKNITFVTFVCWR